jgi:hypothetical protein
MSQVQPTIILRKISPKDIYENYLSGTYDDVEIISGQGVKVENITFTTHKYQTGLFANETSSLRDKTNNLCRIGFSNNETDDEGLCDYCRRPIKICSKGKPPVGIPVRRTKSEEIIFYDLDGFYGRWECAFADLIQQMKMGQSHANALYINSEVYMKNLYHLMYPEKDLIPAKNYRWLKYNRGWMDDEEYEDSSSPFVELPYVILQHNRVINSS